jgi:DNA polymerase (family 10)
VKDVISKGMTKVSARLDSGISSDLRIVKPAEFPCALHHFTGSKEHNVALRHLSRRLNYKINEYGITNISNLSSVECKSEDDVFGSLGLKYIPPELRENTGEIEAASKNELPVLVDEKDIKGYFHFHTTYSDGRNTLEEMVVKSIELGYQYAGVSDHSQSAFYANGLKLDRIIEQHEEIEKLNAKYPQFRILKGIESDIKLDGSLDYPDDVLRLFDFVIASVHTGFSMDSERMTERIIRAVENPFTTILGHPTGRLLLSRDEYQMDLDKILNSALKNGVVVEINANPHRLDLDWRQCKKARSLGVFMAINPDAHSIGGIEDIKYGVNVARKGWLEKKNIINTMSYNEIVEFLKNKKRKI